MSADYQWANRCFTTDHPAFPLGWHSMDAGLSADLVEVVFLFHISRHEKMPLFFPLSECGLFLPEKLQASLYNIKHMPAATIPPKPAVITRQSHVYSSQAHLVSMDVMLLFLPRSSRCLMSLIFGMSLDLIISAFKILAPVSCRTVLSPLSSEKDHTMDVLPAHVGAVEVLPTWEVQLQHWLCWRRRMPVSLRQCFAQGCLFAGFQRPQDRTEAARALKSISHGTPS